MDIEDARKMINAIELIDGGCPYCIDSFISKLNVIFPNLYFSRDKDYGGIGERVVVDEIRYMLST